MGETQIPELPKKAVSDLPDPSNDILFFYLFFEVELYPYVCTSFILFSHLLDHKFFKEKHVVFFGSQLYLSVAMCLAHSRFFTNSY